MALRPRGSSRAHGCSPKGLIAAALFVVTSCGDSADTGCGSVVTEAVHTDSLLHVLTPDADPGYLSDPPTSGPHLSSGASGVVDRTLPPPERVGVLETGAVLIQYRPDNVSVSAIAGLATTDGVVVAPNADLPSAIVATAWATKMECSTADLAALGQFIAERRGITAGHG